MTATRTNPAATCPACRKPLDAATGMGHDHLPEPEDLSICFHCGVSMIFNQDLSLRLATPEEFAELPQKVRDDINHMRTLMAKFQK